MSNDYPPRPDRPNNEEKIYPQPTHYPPQGPQQPYPPQMPPPQYQRPPKRPMTRATKIAIAVVLLGLCAASAIFNASVQQGRADRFAHETATAKVIPPTPTAAPTQPPTPTPTTKPDVTLFDQTQPANNTDGLPVEKAPTFKAEGKLAIDFSCIQDWKDGVDVQFNLLKMGSDGFAKERPWAIKLNCPDIGNDEVTVTAGEYRMTVATSGYVGWRVKVVQKA